MKHEHASLLTDNKDEVLLRSIQVDGHLEGLLLTMTLRQVYRNDTRRNLEVTYTFPLSWGAVLTGLDVTIGARRLSGQVMARKQARDLYEDAVAEGHAPVMVEKAQNGVYSASLGSLKPGEEAIIELRYAQLLSFEQGRIRLVVPTTLAPRYGDAEVDGGLQADQVATPDLLAEHRFGLNMTLHGAMARARISCPTHPVAQQLADGEACVSLQGQAWLDRDFVLLLEGLEGRSFAIVGPDWQSGEGNRALIASYYPPGEQGSVKAPAALCLKVLVDCSGSMGGQSIAQARRALLGLVAQLGSQDCISFSRFGTHTEHVLAAETASPAHLKALKQAISSTDATLGGTEMEDALSETFDLEMPAIREELEADVLLITDGEVWGAQGVVDAARRSGHRVYALGVGSAPAESLLREMAEATGGACEFVTPLEDMREATQRLARRMRQALRVKAGLVQVDTPIWSSALPRRLADGETVHVFLRLGPGEQPAPVFQLEGQLLSPEEVTQRDDALVARIVAAQQVASLTDRAEATALAERYQLVTEETNLLLVFERAEDEKTDGMPELHRVRPMLAAGWGGTGRVLFGKNTTTSFKTAMDNLPVLSTCLDMSFSQNDYSALKTPSVWREGRRRPAAYLARALDASNEIDIPAFLRKQPDPLDASTIVDAFNREVANGRGFEAAVLAVLKRDHSTELSLLLLQLRKRAGNRSSTMACYLIWLHRSGKPGSALTEDALKLVSDAFEQIDDAKRKRAIALLDAQAVTP